MKIVKNNITLDELQQMSQKMFGGFVKAVVDIEQEIMAVDAELHADLEALLLQDGSKQRSLWGVNLYPQLYGDEFVEFDSMINMRPSEGNTSRGVDDEKVRNRILMIIGKRIIR